MEDGVAILGMAGAGNLAQLLGDGVPLAENEVGKDRLMKLLVERKLAGQKPTVERGQGEFEIIRIEFAGFLDGTRTRAGAEPDIPHALDDRPYRFPGLFLCLLVGEGEEHV